MNDSGESVFAYQFRHAASGGDVAGSEARKAGRVHVADLAVKGDRLSVAIDEHDDTGSAFDAEACKDVFDPRKLVFLYYEGRLCHLIFRHARQRRG